MQPSNVPQEGKAQKSGLQHPRLWIAVGVVVCLLGIGGLLHYIQQSPAPTPTPPVPPSLEAQRLRPNQFELTIARFGPWRSVLTGTTGAPHLAMLYENGSAEVAAQVVRVGPAWQLTSQPFPIEAVQPRSHTVGLGFAHHVYELGYDQPFILQSAPTQILAFTRDGPGRALLREISVQQLAADHKSKGR